MFCTLSTPLNTSSSHELMSSFQEVNRKAWIRSLSESTGLRAEQAAGHEDEQLEFSSENEQSKNSFLPQGISVGFRGCVNSSVEPGQRGELVHTKPVLSQVSPRLSCFQFTCSG